MNFTTPQEAVKLIKSNDHVFIQGSVSTPETLIDAMVERAHELQNVTIYNTFAYGPATLVTCNDNSTALVANVGCDNVGGYGLYGSSESPMIVVNGGELTIINMMRWNGTSYQLNGGTLKMYNRLTINIKNEATLVASK